MSHNNISFKKADKSHIKLIFFWLAEPHMMEFWDNSQEHKEDILNFIHDRRQDYFSGTTQYFIASIDEVPYAFLLVDRLKMSSNLPDLYCENLSNTGETIVIDVGIGNKDYLGKGLAAMTIEAFLNFYKKNINSKVDACLIDPIEHNTRAIHVYKKAGFVPVGNFSPTLGAFIGKKHLLMKRKV